MALTLKVGPAGDLLIPGFGSVDTNGLMLSEVQEQAEAVVRQQVRDGVVHVSLIRSGVDSRYLCMEPLCSPAIMTSLPSTGFRMSSKKHSLRQLA